MLEFLETPVFTRQVRDLLSDAEYAALQGALIVNPESGDLIPGTGGLRKMRWQETRRRKGKRGGIRVIYYWYSPSNLHAAHLLEGSARRPYRNSETHLEAARRGGV